MAFPTGWTKKHKISIDNTKVSGSSNLTDFPVVLTEANFLADAFANSLNGGADLRFSTDEAGTTQIPFEIVTWNTGTSVAEVWVKIPTLLYNADTDIYVHYGNSGASALAETDTYGTHNVWGENWEGVWHLNEASGTRMDASKNSYDLTDNNTVTSAVGKLGTAGDFEFSNNEYLSIAHASVPNLEITGSQTWMIWHKPESLGDVRIMDKLTNGRSIAYYADGTARFWSAGLTNTSVDSAAGAVTIGNWVHLVAVYDSANAKIKIFTNATKVEEASSGTLTASTSQFVIGGLNNGASNYIDGLADEARVYNGALSDDFITTLYNNQNAPATFAIPSSLSSGNFFMFL